jgi:CobQ-like glutamine amidotransferase family enzyme
LSSSSAITVSILELYPDELEASGERGNVTALTARLERAGHRVDVNQHVIGRKLPRDPDIVVIGNGPVSAVRAVHEDLLDNAEALRSLADDGVPFFAVGAGAELLGSGITLADETVLTGLGIFPFAARRGVPRQVGYIVVESAQGTIVGFEDNASEWNLDTGAVPLGVVTSGGGNGNGREGVLAGSSIATQTKGPVLPLNPSLTDAIIRVALERRDVAYAPSAAHAELDRLAAKSREVIVANVKSVFTTI